LTTHRMTTRRAAIVAPVRTPVGTFGGSLRAVLVEELAATAVKAVLERTGIDPGLIDDVSFAQSYVNGETPCIGRWAALHAGLPKLFSRTGLAFRDIDLVELNEAFAVQVLAVLAGWQWNEPDKLNVNGSGISLGHPIGATGARMLATGLRELRRRKGRYLLETMCVGGGQGVAAVFEAA